MQRGKHSNSFSRKLCQFIAPNFPPSGKRKKQTGKRDRAGEKTQKIDVNLVDSRFIHFARAETSCETFRSCFQTIYMLQPAWPPAFAHGSIVRTLCLNESVHCVYERVIAVTKTICQFASSVNGFSVALTSGTVHPII